MSPAQESILYTQDADLVRRTKAFLRTFAQVRHVSDPDRLEPVLQQTGPTILMMDLRAKECRDLLDQIHNDQPEVLIIALGIAQSEPLREAEQLGIYAVEEVSRRYEGHFSHLEVGPATATHVRVKGGFRFGSAMGARAEEVNVDGSVPLDSNKR